MSNIDLAIPAQRGWPELCLHRPKLNGKPVFEIDVKTAINFHSEFGEKLLSDGYTFSLGSACAYRCAFCYVADVVRRHPQVRRLLRRLKKEGFGFPDIIIRRRNVFDILREQLTVRRPAGVDLSERKVIFTSPLVDPAANMELVRETVQACRIILELTSWDIRILSKSSFLQNVAEAIPEKFRDRVIFGLSTGTLDDKLAASFEEGTPHVSKRLEALHWMQDHGFRTFGMICPSLPQDNYSTFADKMAEAVRVDRCEHVWAEVINVRGDSLNATVVALQRGGFNREADQLKSVCGPKSKDAWEEYARSTFLAHGQVIPAGKLRFLQYITPQTATWWREREAMGAVLLGKHASTDTEITHA